MTEVSLMRRPSPGAEKTQQSICHMTTTTWSPTKVFIRRLIVLACMTVLVALRLSSDQSRLLRYEKGLLLAATASNYSHTEASTGTSFDDHNDDHDDDRNDTGNSDPNDQNDSSLLNCKRFMQKMSLSHQAIGGGTDFLTSPQTPSRWTLRDDGSREYNLAQHCSLHRYTAQEARRCLLDKHIMFIGDSLTRFQVTSLVYLLERGEYPHRFDRSRRGVCKPFGAPPNETKPADEYGQCSPKNKPNVCVADDFVNFPFPDSWSSFHHQVGGATDGGVFRGRMECDCVRGDLFCHKDRLGCDVENFYYASQPRINGKQTTMSFFFESGWGDHPRPIKGFNFTGCALTGTCRYNDTATQEKREKAYDAAYNFYQPLGDALERNGSLWQVIPPVDVSVYNRGLWGTLTTEQATRYMPLFRDLTAQKQNGQCFFKSTTGSARTSAKSFEHEQTTLRNITLRAGCSFLDMAHITKDFGIMPVQRQDGETNWERETIYQDGIHFRPWVYEEFNNILLNVLCNSNS